MGLIRRILAAIAQHREVWVWRARYWLWDTRAGQMARGGAWGLGVIVGVYQIAKVAIEASQPPVLAPDEPIKAIYWWVVQLIIAIVAAIIAYALRPKPQAPKAAEERGPTTEDGTSAVHYFGEHWIRDEFLLAWKITGKDPIKTKGGKK
jgi:hypothetical protein